MFKLNYSKPIKCKNCNRHEKDHKANTKQCPFGSPRNQRCWPTTFLTDQFFEEKKTKPQK